MLASCPLVWTEDKISRQISSSCKLGHGWWRPTLVMPFDHKKWYYKRYFHFLALVRIQIFMVWIPHHKGMEGLPPPPHVTITGLIWKATDFVPWLRLVGRLASESRQMQQGTDDHCRLWWLLGKTWNLGKIVTTYSSGQHVKPTGDTTQVHSLLRHLSSLQSKHSSQAIPKAPPSCLNHVLIHPPSQRGCMFGLSPKSRKTQLLALIWAPPPDTQPTHPLPSAAS